MSRVPLFALLVAGFLVLAPSVARAEETVFDENAFQARVRADEIDAAVDEARKALAERPDDLALARALQDVLREERRGEEADAVADLVDGALAPYLRARSAPGEEAVAAFQRFADDARFEAWAQLDLAYALRASGDLREAEKAARDHLKRREDSAEGWELAGRIDLERGNPRSAESALEKALAVDPGRPGAAIVLAQARWDPAEPLEARNVLDAALARHPDSLSLRLALVDHHLRVGEVDAAAAVLAKVAEGRAGDLRVLERRVRVLRRQGRYEDAEKAARALLALDPEDPRAHLTLGFVLEKRGQLDAALDQYFEAVQVAPDMVEPYVSAAFILMQQKDYDNADKTLERAFDLDDENVGAHRVKGLLEFFRGESKEAKKHLKEVLKALPEDVAALRAMGYVLLDEGRDRDALEHFEKVLALEPSDAASARMIGRTLLETGKVEDAIAALDKALALDEKDPWIHFDLGKAFEASEEFDAAKESYGKAIELDKTFAWPHLYLAELLDEVEGESLEALTHFQAFLDLGGPDPDHEIAQRISAIKNQ